MEVTLGILGPVELVVDGVDLTPAAPKERALLAVLAVQHPLVVSVDRLIAELWPGLPVDRARHVLQVRVAALRKRLGAMGAVAVLERRAQGYRLALPTAALDTHRFSALVERAQRASTTGDPVAAASAWAEGLALWRGEPLADIQLTVTLDAEVARLTEARFGAVEAWIDAELACGRHESLLPELDALVATHPLRERLSGQRILALYRCDRQAEALRAGAALRRRLIDELGVAPSASLRALETAVLDQRRELDWVPPTTPGRPAPGGPSTGATNAGVRRSEVRYAKSRDGVNIAYQVAGDGPLDVLVVPGYISHLDNWWDAQSGRLVRRLASFARLITFDKRGMGLSDRPPVVDVEDWVEDARAVVDAVGSRQVAVLGVSAGCHSAILFAATYPEHTRSLVLYGGSARMLPDDDYPFGSPIEEHRTFLERTEERWGSGWGASLWCPSTRGDPEVRAHFGKHQRISASPGAGVAYLRAVMLSDVRHALPMVSAPTLVLHPARDQTVPIGMARYVAERIADAALVELDTADHLIWFSEAIDVMTDEIQDFLTGAVPNREVSRMLATVMAIEARPERREAPVEGRGPLLRDPERPTRELVERFRGRWLGQAGTAMLATFDGPARAVRCASAVVEDAQSRGIEVAAGVHSGECERIGEGVGGVAVHIASEVAGLAAPGEVLVSQTVVDLVTGSALTFGPASSCALDGVAGSWRVHAVTGT